MGARAWCLTIGNVEHPLAISDHIRYLCWQRERGSDSEYEHLQVYAEFDKPQRPPAAARHLGLDIRESRGYSLHIAPRKGSQAQAIEYCSSAFYCRKHSCGDSGPDFCRCGREESKGRVAGPWELGTKLGTRGGQRDNSVVSQGVEMRRLARSGASRQELTDNFPCMAIRYSKFVDACLIEAMRNIPKIPPQVYWLHGPSGCGKSRLAAAVLPSDTYFKPPDSKWFDGYDRQRVVVFNDLRKSTFSFSYLLELFDRYRIIVETKGGHSVFNSPCVIVTCSKPPEELWAEIGGTTNENVDQLLRRIKRCVSMPVPHDQALSLLYDMRVDSIVKEPDSDCLYPAWDGGSAPSAASSDLLTVPASPGVSSHGS